MILYHAADLLWATRIKSTADSLGIPCRPVRNLEMLEARLADSQVQALVIDLESPDTGLTLIRRLRADPTDPRTKTIRILAFGPHVATEQLAAAKQSGADAVLARGAFSARLPQILQQLSTDPAAVEDDLHE